MRIQEVNGGKPKQKVIPLRLSLISVVRGNGGSTSRVLCSFWVGVSADLRMDTSPTITDGNEF